MNIKSQVLSSYHLDDNKELEIIKLIDKAEKTISRNIIKNTDFLDPYSCIVSEEILKKHFTVSYIVSGGYDKCERKIFIFFPDFINISDYDLPLKVINISNINDCDHRDVLGSIMSLGLKREKIGDILIHDNLVQVIVHSDIAEYIETNLLRIGKFKVNTSISNINEITPPKEKYKIFSSTVQSLRLDSVSAVGFKESRSNVVSDIKSNKLKVNHRPISSSSYNLCEGDMISYRGKGRIILQEVVGTTKKDRIKIVIKKII